VVKVLLEKRADVNARGSNSETALMFACEYGHAEVVKLLIESGAEIDAKMELEWLEHELRFGWHHDTYNTASSLVLASEYGRLDIVKLLLEKGAQINEDVPIWNPMKTAPDTLTFSPALVYAARGDYRNVVQVLRAKGAIPGPPDMALVIGGISKIKLSDNLPHSVFLRFPDFYGADVVFNAYTNVKWLKLGTQKVGTGFHAGTGKEFIQSRNQVDVSLQVVAGKIYVIRANLWENSWDASVTEY
jgi:ankyrin repeat protein